MLLNSTKNHQNSGKRAVYLAGKGVQEADEHPFSNGNVSDSGKHSRLDHVPIKTSFQQIIQAGSEVEKEVMTKDEIEALRSSVIQLNRPRNPWFETQKPFRKSYSPVSNENQHVKMLKRETVSTTSLSNVKDKDEYTSTTNNNNNGSLKRNLYEAKPVKGVLGQNVIRPQIRQSVNENNDSLKRYSSIATGPSLKQQLLQQQQNVNCMKENSHHNDFDISRALASDIKMLEQLEIEHFRRANNRVLSNAEAYSNPSSSGSETSVHTNYYCDGKNVSPDQRRRVNHAERSSRMANNGIVAPYNSVNDGYSMKNASDNIARNGIDSGNPNNATYQSIGLSSSPSPSSARNDSCSPREQNTRPKAMIIGRNFSTNSFNSSEPQLKGKYGKNSYPICTTCNQPINEVILQALGMSYHASCFRCAKCSCCLDGVPFAVDTAGNVFCMDDYENIFIPACVACRKSISAINEFGQIIRVVFRDEEYHIDCFNCEGCGLQLSNEEHNRCYPISSHLLCRRCHIQWKRLGGIDQPITDL